MLRLYFPSDINECASTPCPTQTSTCVDLVDGFSCVCFNGYNGEFCDEGISYWLCPIHIIKLMLPRSHLHVNLSHNNHKMTFAKKQWDVDPVTTTCIDPVTATQFCKSCLTWLLRNGLLHEFKGVTVA